MKKTMMTIMTAALFLILLTGSAVPAMATIGPDEGVCPTSYICAEELSNEGTTRRVSNTKHFLALRDEPAYKDSDIIGKLHNGDKVTVLGKRSGDYVWVYSADLNKYGWANGNYLQ